MVSIEDMRWNPRWSWKEFCGGGPDSLVVWNPIHGDLDPCFRYLCLELPVLCLLAIVSAYYTGLQLPRIHRSSRELTVLRFRSFFSLVLAALPIVSTYIEVSTFPGSLPPVRYLISAVESIAWLVHSTYTVSLSGRAGRSLRGPSSLGVVWSLRLVLSWVSLRSVVVAPELTPPSPSSLPLIFSVLQVSLLCLYLLTLVPSQGPLTLPVPSPEEEDRAPLLGGYSSFRHHGESDMLLGVAGDSSWSALSRLSFSWVTPLLRKGRQGELESCDDLFELPTSLTPWYLYSKLRSALTEESLYGSKRVTLVRALHRCFWKHFYSVGVLRLMSDVAGFTSPLLLHALVSFVEDPEQPPYNGYLYAAGLTAATLISGVCMAHFNYQMTKVGLKMRGALITTIYRKSLTVNYITLSQLSQGEILNMMSTDVDRIVNSCPSFHAFWSIPFQLGVSLYLLYSQVGVSFLAGVAFSVLLIPINRAIASKIGNLSTKMMKAKDDRLLLTTELLRGIKAVKLYAWESVLFNRIKGVRGKELKYLGGRKYLDALCVYFWATTPVLISILTFSVYVYTGHTLTAPLVFTTMALLNMLIAPLNSFPWVLNGLVEAWVSVRRLEKLIELPEMELDGYYSAVEGSVVGGVVSPTLLPGELIIKDGCFQWSDPAALCLSSINIHVRPGQFVGVTGPVGCGKSSLFSAILAEMEKSSGTISIGDYESGIGYVAQTPWLQRGSIRSNILFGEAFDHNIYSKVLEACCLLEDLEVIAGGDEASVGEGGSMLSGGQRARIALARAVYKNHSLYLLDDILSGVDPEVASHIYKRCIDGLLKNRTRILCTHQTKFLIHADWIIVMKDGHIISQGVPGDVLPDYDEIMANSELESERSSSYDPVPGNIKEEEIPQSSSPEEPDEKASGFLDTGVYTMYLKAVGVVLVCAIILFVTLMQASRNAVDWWMAFWVSSLNNTNTTFPNSTLSDSISVFTSTLSSDEEKTWFYLTVYLGLAGGNSVVTLGRAFLFAYGGLVAARSIHNKLVLTVLSAKLWLFDVTPVGRLLNRFSSDTYTIDDSLPFIINILLAQVFTLVGTVVITVYGLPWLLLVLAPLVPIYHWIQDHYRRTSREMKRLTSASLSPLYSHFTESIQGLVTVRAFKASSRFKRDNSCLLEASQKAQLCAGAVAQWLSFRLQMIGVALVSGVGILTAIQHHLDHAVPGLVGLALSYALTVSGSLGGVVNAFTETERELVSVERIRSYLVGGTPHAPPASPKKILAVDPVPFGWPQFGVVSFNSVSLKYRDHLPLSLIDVTFETFPAERIGVVGRTGAGKSSLILALFKLVNLYSGYITIDGVDINSISDEKLRRSLGVIPQEPLVLNGSARENLDPEGFCSSSELWTALENAGAAALIRSIGGLDSDLRPDSLSLGQRQLLCLARAVLRRPKIVCIDEATASVDEETDRLIQETMRSCFRQSTVITIAHRVSTVLDNDRVLVMGSGKILEFDNPHKLLQDSNSHFYRLVHQAGSGPSHHRH